MLVVAAQRAGVQAKLRLLTQMREDRRLPGHTESAVLYYFCRSVERKGKLSREADVRRPGNVVMASFKEYGVNEAVGSVLINAGNVVMDSQSRALRRAGSCTIFIARLFRG